MKDAVDAMHDQMYTRDGTPMKPNIQSRVFFYILFAFSAYLAYVLIGPYMGTVVLAVVTVTVFQPMYDLFVRLLKGRRGLATTLTIITIFVVVLVPVGAVLSVAVQQALEFSRDITRVVSGAEVYPSLTDLLAQINHVSSSIPFAEGFQLTPDKVYQAAESTARAVGTFLAEGAISLSGASADVVISLVIYISLLSALFPSYPRILQTVRKMSPLSDEMDERYIQRITIITKSMVRGVFVLAVAQGLTMGLFFWIGGVKYASFWTLAAIFAAMFPPGCGIVGVPIGIIHIILGNVWQGLVILLGYAVVVSGMQYYLTPRLVSRQARLNSALVLLSVFGGLKMFGFMGLVYGPVIMIFLVTTIEIYLDYYRITKSAATVEALGQVSLAASPIATRGERVSIFITSATASDEPAVLEGAVPAVEEQSEEAVVAEMPMPWRIWSAVRRLPQRATPRFSMPWAREHDTR
jgi:predicted PurR-regulated permease PerM